MPNLTPGDLVTFPLRGDKYGVAHLIHIDDLALNDLYHFALCDAVVEGSEGEGYDELGDPIPREHDVAAVETAPTLVEHIGLTRHGLELSDLSVVSVRDVSDEDLRGYHVWLQMRYEDAVKRGIMRERIDDNVDEEFIDEEASEEDAGERIENDEVSEASTEEAAAEEATTSLEVATDDAMSFGVHDVALGLAVVRHRSVFEREKYRGSTLGRFILGLADDTGAIDEIIARLLDGDFGAGDELIDYGDVGMERLGERLGDVTDPQVADDALQVLVNSGETGAYERVGAYMEEHGVQPDDPLYGSAVRAFCYAVMLTSGEPEALKTRLPLLEAVKDPDLADDLRSAREALAGEG
jgi:hypothetical protein